MGNEKILIEKAEEIIQIHGLSDEDIIIWKKQLTVLSSDNLSLFIEIFENDSMLLILATKNMKKKLAAGNDPQKIQVVIDEEKKEIMALLNE